MDKCLRIEKDFVLCKIAFNVISAFHYLHEKRKVIHWDVKPSPVLVSSTGHVKMCYFNISSTSMYIRPAIPIDAALYLAPERIDSSQIPAN